MIFGVNSRLLLNRFQKLLVGYQTIRFAPLSFAFVLANLRKVQDIKMWDCVAFVAESEASHRGGTHRYEAAVMEALEESGVEVVRCSFGGAMSLVNERTGPVLVFTQQEGRLSREYNLWAKGLLDQGAFVLEMNVFNLPSKWRPSHPKYVMACMSMDGLARWRIRSFCRRRERKQLVLILPLYMGRKGSWGPRRKKEWEEPLRLYRQGRPDQVKWSDFEVRFTDALNRASCNAYVLRLRGSPLPNLQRHRFVESVEFTDDKSVIQDDYERSLAYVHYCRIGETFGFSIFDAFFEGLKLLVVVNPFWDNAPASYLSGENVMFATRNWMMRNVDVVDRFLRRDSEVQNDRGSLMNGKMLEGFGARIVDPELHVKAFLAVGSATRCPSLWSCGRYLVQQLSLVHGVRVPWIFVSYEFSRGLLLWFSDLRLVGRLRSAIAARMANGTVL